jgi:hypothetical protein
MLIEIIAVAAITNLWVHSEPSNKFRYWLYKDQKDKDGLWHWRLINCAMCSGFWLGLIVTLSLYQAAIISIVAELICKKLTEGGL